MANFQQGGSIRGFMNDGTLDYKSYHSVDSLAFGHCDYSYRNLGRPSKLQIKQSDNLFEVVVDDRLCFSTNKVHSQSLISFPNASLLTSATYRLECQKTTISVLRRPHQKSPTLSRYTNSSYSQTPRPHPLHHSKNHHHTAAVKRTHNKTIHNTHPNTPPPNLNLLISTTVYRPYPTR